MIHRLFISNYALIEKADIELDSGFSVITGETGAGKSILLGAIGLILGERADYSALKNRDKKCIIEGEFKIENYKLKDFFKKNDLDYENYTIIRREISPSGKSRAFINDTPVNLSLLKEFTSRLINIHSQNQTHQLKNEDFIISLIDSYSDKQDSRAKFREVLKNLKQLEKEQKELLESSHKLKTEADYNRFQFEEIQALNLSKVDFDQLKEEVELAANQEQIQSSLENTLKLLDEDDLGVLSRLRQIKAQVASLQHINKDFASIYERIESGLIDLSDVQGEIESKLEGSSNIESSQQKIELYDEINRLLQKHFLNEVDELIELEQELSTKIEFADHSDETLERLENEIQEARAQLDQIGNEIHLDRQKIAKQLQQEIENLLHDLVLPNAKVKFRIQSVSDYRKTGKDQVQFLFNANLGGELTEISKSASGGETSRLMLAVQFLLSKKKSLATLIFDEIDTGISGEIASKIGDLLSKISGNLQVISITHLPQVASKGSHHYKVFKEDAEHQTKTYIQKLSKEERIHEIAKMLSGDQVNTASLENAKSLLTF